MADRTNYPQPEQDTPNDNPDGDALPTYEDLAAQKGPNSRFGRWRGWVEKRAAERYLDITPAERARRRERGWGDDIPESSPTVADDASSTIGASSQSDWQSPQSDAPQAQVPHEPPSYSIDDIDAPLPKSGEPLLPTHVMLHNFGSRFLPHTTSPIRAILPLLGDRFILIGHDDGLSVLDMVPTGNPETSGPADAEIRAIWEGEGVYQLELLEFQNTGDLTPHGVVLALVGGDSENCYAKDNDSFRTIRMYNLASLISLARYAAAQKQGSPPIDLRRPKDWSPQISLLKKHRHHSSITKGFRGLIVEQPVHATEPQASYQNIGPPQVPPKSNSFSSLKRGATNVSIDGSWDMVDDLPLRWATNYVPLASAGSRLSNSSVQFFELKRNESAGFSGPATLAVATKNGVLLYETSKGERAFRFTKEFYTPLQPRSITFVEQSVSETVLVRSPSASSTSGRGSTAELGESRRFSIRSQNTESSRDRLLAVPPTPNPDYGSQLSLFVVFEKKAGLIRLADSAVAEVDLYEEPSRDAAVSPTAVSPRRPKSSLEAFGFARDPKGLWIAPVFAELPVPTLPSTSLSPTSTQPQTRQVYFITRGRLTHILPCPLLTPLVNCPPLKVLTWLNPPRSLAQRVCIDKERDGREFLQVIAFGEYGVEVQELSLGFLAGNGNGNGRRGSGSDKGKGRVVTEEVLRAQADVGGDAGLLCRGGQWHRPISYLSRSDSVASFSTMSTLTISENRHLEEGFYGWVRKDTQDWRVIWLGGHYTEDSRGREL